MLVFKWFWTIFSLGAPDRCFAPKATNEVGSRPSNDTTLTAGLLVAKT